MKYMERAMSVEDKIRRAEEIYYRRKNQEMPAREVIKRNAKPKKNIKLLKKMIKQIIICLIIYGIFYLIINNNYIFSEDFTQKAREILSQDINFSQIYSVVLNKIDELFQKQDSNERIDSENNQEQSEQIENNKDEKQEENQNQQEEKTKEEIQNNEENIGGAEELPTTEEQNVENTGDSEVEATKTEEAPVLSQMEQDANYIKSTINFIKPVNGTISSMFGWRNPTTASVPKNHTGTDIAAIKGTKIVSATDGTVIFKSSKGDFGNHLKIQINDVIVLYAHCNKLYVNEGDVINQGQEIGEVGSTGNTTGPHLHFEIRYQDRYVDPQLILEL